MEISKQSAASVQRSYAQKLDQLKARDNVQDTDERPGVIAQDGFRAAYVEHKESFAFVTQQGSKLEYAVFTPDGPVQSGSIDANGESYLEQNIATSGLTSGHQSDYDEVAGYKVADERTRGFAQRKEAEFSAALDQAFKTGKLSKKFFE